MKTEIGVLIVDDDPIFRLDLQEMLRTMGYLVVGEAEDAQRALALARKLRPELIIMDVRTARRHGRHCRSRDPDRRTERRGLAPDRLQ